ncbi:MAG: SBBP repeat-containing protein [Acidobacteria bacterium]|nr:SBBP repeat-containing protein [Acidobacteriota bacterium]
MRSFNSRPRRLLALTLFLSFAAGSLGLAFVSNFRRAPARPGARAASPAPERALETYGRIPLSFEANRGQADDSVDFLARGAGYSLFLKPSEATFVLFGRGAGAPSKGRAPMTAVGGETPAAPAVLRMKLVGADASAAAEGAEELEGKANYLVGDDASKWRTGVPTYGRVRYASVYPGVDLVYYGNQRQLEYDFRIAPGADPGVVSLHFEGADKVEVGAEGDLLLAVGGSVVRQPKPFVYQEVAGARRAVKGGYAIGADGRVGFALGAYDAALPLVIDPVIVYSTYLGGSDADQANGVGVDSAGNVYVAGFTASTNFPTSNALQAANGGFQDAFITKINAAGNALVYSTYLGGSAQEQARGLTVDSAGNAYVTGVTGSTNFPTANAFDATIGATNEDAFLTKLNAAGNALVYSTYLGGGTSSEFGQAVAVDSAGNAYVTGSTFSTDFPTLNPIQAAKGGGSTDAFLTKFNAAGSALVYSTYLGGGNNDTGFGVAADSSGNAYVVGETESTNFPTANAIQAANGGGRDAFVAKVNATGSAFIFSTYLGGSGDIDVAQSVAVDSAGLAYVAGQTDSTNFPTANAFQGANGGGVLQDAFLTKFNAAGTAFVYSTYYGGSGGEIAFGVAVDSAGNAYIAGTTASLNTLPTANAVQCTRSGSQDVFVAKFNAAASALVYSTYLGGGDIDNGRMVAVDSAGNAYVTGTTFSTDFPTVTPIQSTFAGGAGLAGDAFVFKLSDASAGPASALAFTQTAPVVQEEVTSLTLTVQRTGDTSGAVTVDYATANGTASERSDYTTAVGTLRFAAGETAKTFDVLVNEDSFAEGNETFTVTLSNATGGATLSCATAVATVQITDDGAEPTTNVIDDATIFTGQHYHDFLNRQADPTGLAFWANQIIACGGDAACVDRKRTDVSTAFFLSIEFQTTGYYVFRIYKGSFTDTPARPRGMPRYREFLRDQQEVGRGVVVNQGSWQAQLDANRQEFARRWVQRSDFIAQFPLSMSGDDYVNKLAANLGVTPLSPSEFNIAIESYTQTVEGRATTLRNVVELNSVYNRQFNAAFVLSQYIGYLRRNPNDAPDTDYTGFDFWLAKMDSFSLPGENVRDEAVALARVRRAEMVRAFILSSEYRGRFGQP